MTNSLNNVDTFNQNVIIDQTGQTATCYKNRLPFTNYDVQDEDYGKALSSPTDQQMSSEQATLLNDFTTVVEPNPPRVTGTRPKGSQATKSNFPNQRERDFGERNLQRTIQGAKNSFHQYKSVVKKQNNTFKAQAPLASVENLKRMLTEIDNSSHHFTKLTKRLFNFPLGENVKEKFEASYETYKDLLDQSRWIVTQQLQQKAGQDCPPAAEEHPDPRTNKNNSTPEVQRVANGDEPFPAHVPTPSVVPSSTHVEQHLGGYQKGDEPFLSHQTPHTTRQQHSPKSVNIQDFARQEGNKIRQNIRQ